MLNYDEQILRNKRVDFNAPFPPLHQAVRIALYDEYEARAFYLRVVEAFGEQAPFSNIIRSEERHIEQLYKLCDRFGIPRPLDPFMQELRVEPTWLANCLRAVDAELCNANLYTDLLQFVVEPEVINTFQRLQSASLNNHLPAFQQAAQAAQIQESYHAAHGVPASEAYVKHGPIADFLESTLARLETQLPYGSLVSPIIRNTPPALLSGLLVGGVSVWLYKTKSSKSKLKEQK